MLGGRLACVTLVCRPLLLMETFCVFQTPIYLTTGYAVAMVNGTVVVCSTGETTPTANVGCAATALLQPAIKAMSRAESKHSVYMCLTDTTEQAGTKAQQAAHNTGEACRWRTEAATAEAASHALLHATEYMEHSYSLSMQSAHR